MAALRRISQRKDGTILVYSWILQGDVSPITILSLMGDFRG
jgi:hypothetical protein